MTRLHTKSSYPHRLERKHCFSSNARIRLGNLFSLGHWDKESRAPPREEGRKKVSVKQGEEGGAIQVSASKKGESLCTCKLLLTSESDDTSSPVA